MTIFDTEEKNLREQVIFLETENNALKAHIIELERDNKALLDNCMKMQEQRLEDGRVIAALKLENEHLKSKIEEANELIREESWDDGNPIDYDYYIKLKERKG